MYSSSRDPLQNPSRNPRPPFAGRRASGARPHADVILVMIVMIVIIIIIIIIIVMIIIMMITMNMFIITIIKFSYSR